jgi:hypothetical protein
MSIGRAKHSKLRKNPFNFQDWEGSQLLKSSNSQKIFWAFLRAIEGRNVDPHPASSTGGISLCSRPRPKQSDDSWTTHTWLLHGYENLGPSQVSHQAIVRRIGVFKMTQNGAASVQRSIDGYQEPWVPSNLMPWTVCCSSRSRKNDDLNLAHFLVRSRAEERSAVKEALIERGRA